MRVILAQNLFRLRNIAGRLVSVHELEATVGAAPTGRNVGQILEEAREAAGMTLRSLSEATGIPLTSLHRLAHDQVARPEPAHLVLIADALGVPRAALFTAAGYPRPTEVESVDAVLRRTYDLPDEAFSKIHAAIANVVEQYSGRVRGGEAER